MITTICEYCHSPFTVHEYRWDTARFCSLSCHAKWKNKQKREIRTCKLCGKEFETIKSPPKIYCSRECYYKARSMGLYITKKKCLTCGNEFIPKSRTLRSKYCSPECSPRFLKGYKPWNKGKKNVYSSKVLDKLREARKKLRMPTTRTKPERIFEELCEKYNLPFCYVGDGSFWIENLNPDFIESGGKKICVDVFGDYWHSPLKRPNLHYAQTYKGRKKILGQKGWNSIIFWEHELKSQNAEKKVLDRLEEENVTLTRMV